MRFNYGKDSWFQNQIRILTISYSAVVFVRNSF